MNSETLPTGVPKPSPPARPGAPAKAPPPGGPGQKPLPSAKALAAPPAGAAADELDQAITSARIPLPDLEPTVTSLQAPEQDEEDPAASAKATDPDLDLAIRQVLSETAGRSGWDIDDEAPGSSAAGFDQAAAHAEENDGGDELAEAVIRSWPSLDSRSPPPVVRPTRPRPSSARSIAIFVLSLIPAVAALVHHFVIPLQVLATWNEPARLDVATQPPGAAVLLDGRPLSAPTPTYTEVRRDRLDHVVEVRKDGFQPLRRPMRFDRSEALVLTVNLLPESRPSFEPMPVSPAAIPTSTTPSASRR
jgi:hypothetical protein